MTRPTNMQAYVWGIVCGVLIAHMAWLLALSIIKGLHAV